MAENVPFNDQLEHIRKKKAAGKISEEVDHEAAKLVSVWHLFRNISSFSLHV